MLVLFTSKFENKAKIVVQWQKHSIWTPNIWIQVLALSLTSCLNLNNLFNISRIQFHKLKIGKAVVRIKCEKMENIFCKWQNNLPVLNTVEL